ncbi:MAG: hypothetical protein HGA26_08540, partial [Chlorobiaceae bacterium]|nr:hypothetical protein [Chlorobiaceae bacterium]
MKRNALSFLLAALFAGVLVTALFIVNQISVAASLLGRLHPYAGLAFIAASTMVMLGVLLSGVRLFGAPKAPPLP